MGNDCWVLGIESKLPPCPCSRYVLVHAMNRPCHAPALAMPRTRLRNESRVYGERVWDIGNDCWMLGLERRLSPCPCPHCVLVHAMTRPRHAPALAMPPPLLYI